MDLSIFLCKGVLIIIIQFLAEKELVKSTEMLIPIYSFLFLIKGSSNPGLYLSL